MTRALALPPPMTPAESSGPLRTFGFGASEQDAWLAGWFAGPGTAGVLLLADRRHGAGPRRVSWRPTRRAGPDWAGRERRRAPNWRSPRPRRRLRSRALRARSRLTSRRPRSAASWPPRAAKSSAWRSRVDAASGPRRASAPGWIRCANSPPGLAPAKPSRSSPYGPVSTRARSRTVSTPPSSILRPPSSSSTPGCRPPPQRPGVRPGSVSSCGATTRSSRRCALAGEALHRGARVSVPGWELTVDWLACHRRGRDGAGVYLLARPA